MYIILYYKMSKSTNVPFEWSFHDFVSADSRIFLFEAMVTLTELCFSRRLKLKVTLLNNYQDKTNSAYWDLNV